MSGSNQIDSDPRGLSENAQMSTRSGLSDGNITHVLIAEGISPSFLDAHPQDEDEQNPKKAGTARS
jgi:hypothetical protein